MILALGRQTSKLPIPAGAEGTAVRTILAATLIVCLAAPVCAQDFNVLGAASMKRKTQDEADQENQRNKAYEEKLKQLPDQNVKTDPWGNMRGTGASQSEPKPKQTQASHKQKKTGAQ